MSFKPTAGTFSATAPAWSPDGDHLTIATGRLMHTYSLRTTPPTRVATLLGHAAPITSVVAFPGLRLLSTSVDGTLREWDQLSGHCLCTRDLARPIRAVAPLPHAALLLFDSTLVYHPLPASTPSLTTLRQKPSPLLSGVKQFDSQRMQLAADPAGDLVAIAAGKFLTLTAVPALGAVPKNWQHHPYLCVTFPFELTAAAVAPDGRTVAVADVAGKVYLAAHAKELLSNRGAPMASKHPLSLAEFRPTVLHWHSSPVPALTFTRDGAALLSAGREAVLVSWALSRHGLTSPSFLPRLRAPVCALAVPSNSARVALVQADNTARIVDVAAGELVTALRGIAPMEPMKIDAATGTPASFRLSGASIVPAGGPNLLVAAGPSVQTFDALAGSHVAELPVVTRNMLFEKDAATDPYAKPGSHGRDGPGLDHPRVTCVARSLDGRWLATVDHQNVETADKKLYGGEPSIATLRVWQSVRGNHDYDLVSVTTHPHGVGIGVSSLAFHPTQPILMSTSLGGSFRLWRAAGGRDGQTLFRCELKREYRGLPCDHGAFSEDGSLLGIAFGSVLTLWQLDDYDMRPNVAPPGDADCTLHIDMLQALVHPPAEESIARVAYAMRKVPLFIATTAKGLYVWNAFTQSLWWSSRLLTCGHCLAVDPLTGRFAVAVQIPLVVNDTDDSGDMDNRREMPSNSNTSGQKLTSKRKERRIQARSKSAKNSEQSKTTGDENMAQKRLHEDLITDWAVAEFDAGSPVPLRVVRLGSGVAVQALVFVQREDGTQEGSSGGETSHLVCLDSNGEVSVLVGDEETAEMSFISGHSDLLASAEPPVPPDGGLTVLLGAEWHESAAEVDASAPDKTEMDVVRMPLNLQNAFDKHFDGPVHIQAPVSTKSRAFLESILEGMDDDENDETSGNDRKKSELPTEGRVQTRDVGYRAVGGNAKGSDYGTKDTAVRLTHEEIRLCCRQLVQLARDKAKQKPRESKRSVKKSEPDPEEPEEPEKVSKRDSKESRRASKKNKPKAAEVE